MWTKTYFAVLGLSLAIMGFFTFYSLSWLQSIGLPAAASVGYEYHAGLSWPVLWISAIVLLMLGNAVLWTTGRAWALWGTFAHFAIFVVAKYFWLERAFAQFRVGNGLVEDTISAGPFFGVLMIVFMAIAVFVDQFIVIRLRSRTYPQSPPANETPDTEAEK